MAIKKSTDKLDGFIKWTSLRLGKRAKEGKNETDPKTDREEQKKQHAEQFV